MGLKGLTYSPLYVVFIDLTQQVSVRDKLDRTKSQKLIQGLNLWQMQVEYGSAGPLTVHKAPNGLNVTHASRSALMDPA